MNNFSAFLTNFFLTAFSHIGSIVLSIILIIKGAINSKVCLYIGLFLIISNIIVALVGAIRKQSIMNYRSDDPEFNEMMENLSANPKVFLSEMMETQEENKQLHGEELLKLSDDDLLETINFQNLDIAEEAEDEDNELEQFTGARRTVYILDLFDSEIQNGGLCQFFVNSSSVVAPYIIESLKCIGANEHLNLFKEFIETNNIDVSNLESFKVFSKRGYIKQTKRFDFDAFDDKYYELPALEEKIVTYIKNNINEF